MIKRLLLCAVLSLAFAAPASAAKWSTEVKKFVNISATPATFLLSGGAYGITVHATAFSSGTVTLQRLSADGVTFVTCVTAFSSDGYATSNLPAGTYQLTIASATGVYVDISSVIVNK